MIHVIQRNIFYLLTNWYWLFNVTKFNPVVNGFEMNVTCKITNQEYKIFILSKDLLMKNASQVEVKSHVPEKINELIQEGGIYVSNN